MELYHHAEKHLFAARGVLEEVTVRDLRLTVGSIDSAHIDFLNANILSALDRLEMPHHPGVAPAAIVQKG
jgi:hypothetical protein